MRQSEPWGAIAVPMESQSKQEPTTENARAWRVEVRQKGQRVHPVPLVYWHLYTYSV